MGEIKNTKELSQGPSTGEQILKLPMQTRNTVDVLAGNHSFTLTVVGAPCQISAEFFCEGIDFDGSIPEIVYYA